MFDLEKAIERNKLVKAMQTMCKKELVELEPCDCKCPPWLRQGECCIDCHDSIGYYSESEMAELPEEIIELLNRPEGALGTDGCEIDRASRSLICLKELCNPFQKVAGVKNG